MRRNPTEYDRDWQDAERKIREARNALPTAAPGKLHKNMHRLIYIHLREAELHCELMRAKELLPE